MYATTYTLALNAGASLGMVSTVSGIIVRHLSIDGKLKVNHFNFERPIPNFFQVEQKELYKDLIEAFNFTGQMVLDTMTKGKTEHGTVQYYIAK